MVVTVRAVSDIRQGATRRKTPDRSRGSVVLGSQNAPPAIPSQAVCIDQVEHRVHLGIESDFRDFLGATVLNLEHLVSPLVCLTKRTLPSCHTGVNPKPEKLDND